MKRQTALDTIPTTGMRNLPWAKIGHSSKAGKSDKSKLLGPLAAVNQIYNSPLKHELPFDTELGYTMLDDLLGAIVGDPTVSGDGIATAFANTYVPAAIPKYRYIQIIDGDIPTTKAQGFKNCLVVEVTISFSADNPLGTVSAKIVGQMETAAPGTGETVVTTGLVTVGAQSLRNTDWTVWNLGVGSDTTYCLKDGTIKLSRPYKDDRACVGPGGYKAPVFTGPLEASYEFTAEYADAAILAAIEAQTVLTGIRLKAVGGATGIGSDFYTLEMRSSKALIPDWNLEIGDNGQIYQKWSSAGYGNAGSGLAYEAYAAKLTSNYDGATL